jgi:hypothetical protein
VPGSPTQVAITPDGSAAYVVGLPAFVAVISTPTPTGPPRALHRPSPPG